MRGKKKLADTFRTLNSLAAERTGGGAGCSLHITDASCLGNTAVGIGKLAMGLLSLSLFTCVSAFYTFGMVTAKCFALAGILKENDPDRQYWYYKASGLILIAASLLYILYSSRLFLHPAEESYPQNIALGIASFTFTELTLNIRGLILERRRHSPLIHALRMINLSSSLICLVLTQTALLSFTSGSEGGHASANGFMGVLMGSAAALLGVSMVLRMNRLQKRGRDGLRPAQREETMLKAPRKKETCSEAASNLEEREK